MIAVEELMLREQDPPIILVHEALMEGQGRALGHQRFGEAPAEDVGHSLIGRVRPCREPDAVATTLPRADLLT